MTDDDPVAPAPTPAEAPARGAARPAGFVLAVSLAVVFGLLAAVLGVVALGADGGDGEPDGLRELRTAAGQAAEAFFTYDHADLEAHKARMLEISTGSFRKEYDEAFDQGLGAIITRVQATSEGFVKDVYVSSIDDSRAEAVVVSDVEHDGTGGPQTSFDIYILMSFVRVDGDWKVDDVTDLQLDRAGAPPNAADPSSAATTSSSTPVP